MVVITIIAIIITIEFIAIHVEPRFID